jgi:hypothetical protein
VASHLAWPIWGSDMTSERERSGREEEARTQLAQLHKRVRAAAEHAQRERERGRAERARAEAQRAQWAETARFEERARAEAQRAQWERQRGREEWARGEALRAQWAEIARLEERARAAERRARWEQLTQSQDQAQSEKENARSQHVRSAYFLLAIAVRLLPPSERDRYLEEFRAELLDIPRDTRLTHALSLLRGAFVLRIRRGLKKATDVEVRRTNGFSSTRST